MLEAPECNYPQAAVAEQEAAQAYAEAQRIPGPLSPTQESYIEQKRADAEAANRRKQYAQECEARARERSDLAAQWRSAQANIAAANAARDQIDWTIVEIVALIGTIGVGIVAWNSSHTHARRQLRAYIGLSSGTITRMAPNQKFRVSLTFKNNGQTPADDVIDASNFVYCTVPPSMDFTPVSNGVTTPHTVNPGSEFDIRGETREPITQAQIDAIKAGSSALIFYGKITYLDAFRRRRETFFRLRSCLNDGGEISTQLEIDVAGNRQT